MVKLKKVAKPEDIPEEIRPTPVGDLLRYHNLGFPFRKHDGAELLIGMCMDNRKYLIE